MRRAVGAARHGCGAHHGGDAEVIANRDDDLDDLRGQLARRRENEGLAVAHGEVDVLQQTCAHGGQGLRVSLEEPGRRKSRVGAGGVRRRAPMVKVAVLPVPDWACAMVSRIIRSGLMARCWMADGFSKPYE